MPSRKDVGLVALMLGVVLVVGGAAALALNPSSSQQVQGKTTYDFQGEMTVYGSNRGVQFESVDTGETNFEYTTSESNVLSGLSFYGPSSSLSLIGPSNVRFDWELVRQSDGLTVNPPEESLSSISPDDEDDQLAAGENVRINMDVDNLPSGTYDFNVESTFQCGSFLSPDCTGQSSFSTTVEIPKGSGSGGSEVINQ